MALHLRKIVIVNTADEGGGAEQVSMAALDGFLEAGIDAWLLVGNKRRDHPRIVSFFTSPHVDYRRLQDASEAEVLEQQRQLDRSQGLEDFNYPYSHRIEALTGSPPDLVLCHNLHGGYFDLRALPALSARVPVVLRLFDTWLMTGHCAYSLGCGRWRDGCGDCPDLTIPPAIEFDGTRANLARKREIYAESRLYVSAETRWMLDQARQSVLAPAAVDWRHVPGGVDLSIFQPGSRSKARERLRLDPADRVLLFVANEGAANRYKDFATVRGALAALRDRPPGRLRSGKTVLLVVGGNAPDEWVGPNILIRHLGYVDTKARLALLYRACDLLIHAAIEETFGNVVAEAMACGRPAVVASGGGVVELIEPGRTGLLVPPRRPDLLAEAIGQLLDDPARRAAMGAAAETVARAQLDGAATIRNLLSWFTEIHADWHMTRDEGSARQ